MNKTKEVNETKSPNQLCWLGGKTKDFNEDDKCRVNRSSESGYTGDGGGGTHGALDIDWNNPNIVNVLFEGMIKVSPLLF